MSPRGSERFPKSARLRKRPEFSNLSRTGNKLQSANFVVISQTHNGAESRLGITVSAKVGNSVVRNRLKRQVREFFRRRRAELPAGTDFLVIARNSAGNLPSDAIVDELERTLVNRRKRHKS